MSKEIEKQLITNKIKEVFNFDLDNADDKDGSEEFLEEISTRLSVKGCKDTYDWVLFFDSWLGVMDSDLTLKFLASFEH